MIEFLDNTGINDKYYQWKELLTQSILFPILTFTDVKHEFHIYGARNTPEMLEELPKELLQKMDKNYNHILKTKLAFLVKLIKEEDRELVAKAGYFPDDLFTVFKDDILKAENITSMLAFESIDPDTFLQEKLN
jgi:hypothetical protein